MGANLSARSRVRYSTRAEATRGQCCHSPCRRKRLANLPNPLRPILGASASCGSAATRPPPVCSEGRRAQDPMVAWRGGGAPRVANGEA